MSSKRSELIEQLSGALRDRDDVRLALLFGSWAKDRGRADSDVDVAVLAPGVDLLGLGVELERSIGAVVDVVSLESASIPLLVEIVGDGVVVHQGRPGAAASWRTRALVELETDWYGRMRDAWLARVAAKGL
jgi:predicted nucleotidyltransferase